MARHKAFKRKQKVQSGEEHFSRSGKLIPGKKFVAQLKCPCQKKCADKIDVIRQKEIFDDYYALPNWTQKTSFLFSLAERHSLKKRYNPILSVKKRNHSSKFFLVDNDGNKRQVCSTFLSQMLKISKKKLTRATMYEAADAVADRRGKFPSKKIKYADTEFAKECIQEYATYESRYKMSATSSKYLHPDLNLRKIYSIYRDRCQFTGNAVLSESSFRNSIFKPFFDLKFRKRGKGECAKCKRLEKHLRPLIQSVKARHNLEQQKDRHISNAKEIQTNFLDSVESSRELHSKTVVLIDREPRV